jgi:integrase
MEQRLPIFSRPTKTGAYWYCYVRTPDGRRLQRALHIRNDGTPASERAAIAAYWQEQGRATAGRSDRPKPKTTLAHALDALIREQKNARIGEHTTRDTLRGAAWILKHFGSDTDVLSVDRQALSEYTSAALTLRAAVSVDREISVLCRALEAVGVDPPRRPKLKREHKKQEPLTEAELRRFLMAARPQHKLPLLVLCTLGVRRGEYARMTTVDWERRLIFVAGTKVGRARRWVPIPDELWEHMQSLRDEWSGFPPFATQSLYTMVVETAKRAGLGHRHPNDLRGTWATQAALRGISAAERAAIQGHSEAMQTRTYSQPHLDAEALRGAMSGMPRLTGKPAPCITSASANAGIAAKTAAPHDGNVHGITNKKH